MTTTLELWRGRDGELRCRITPNSGVMSTYSSEEAREAAYEAVTSWCHQENSEAAVAADTVRRLQAPKKLTCNRARCRKCNDIVESTTTHHYQACRCGAIFVDGGLEYVRRGYDEPGNFEDLSEYEAET